VVAIGTKVFLPFNLSGPMTPIGICVESERRKKSIFTVQFFSLFVRFCHLTGI
jgi:hypothetical protein